jgi:hypothetical protein
MAGTIVADTLTHSTAGSIATNYVVEGSAKAWADWTGTGTPTLNDSLNVASLIDDGTGDQSITFTSSFSSNYYTIATGANQQRNGTGWGWQATDYKRTTSLSRIRSFDSSFTLVDVAVMNNTIHGELA